MKKHNLIIIAHLIIIFSACRKDDLMSENGEEIIDLTNYVDWTDATHGNSTTPNYDIVFNQNEVLRFDIKINSDDWSDMQSDLSSVLSSGGGRPGGMASITSDPMWIPCSFKFNDMEWYHVGIRYKGNSSLRSTYQSGLKKFSFKLDFNEFDDDYPTIKNQRFYGFRQLNLKNNYDDASLMREKVGADLFRQFGLASSYTAFCAVYLDHGDGPQYYGVYTLVEEVDDTVIKDQFSNGSGNLYKPDGNAASFAQGTYNDSQMEKKTNEDLSDYSDVKTLYDIINSSERSSNTDTWKSDLNGIFNVNVFLKWLAANTVIQNWDTYGNMTHNYYLYNSPADGLLHWIPWDNNEAFQEGKQSGALNLSLNEVGNSWPLIRYLIDQPEYKLIYQNYLQQFIDEVFIPSEISSVYSNHYQLIKEFVYAEEAGYSFIRSNSEFDQAVESLKYHVQSRNDAVRNYIE